MTVSGENFPDSIPAVAVIILNVLAGGKLEAVPVTFGLSDGANTALKAKDLKAGDRVWLSPDPARLHRFDKDGEVIRR